MLVVLKTGRQSGGLDLLTQVLQKQDFIGLVVDEEVW
jgi:hypothetical protein